MKRRDHFKVHSPHRGCRGFNATAITADGQALRLQEGDDGEIITTPITNPNSYERKLLALSAAGRFTPGTYSETEVLHDPWCGYPERPCDCDPDIVVDGARAEVGDA